LKKLFVIAIGEVDGEYFANVDSLTDNKHATVNDTSPKRMLAKMNKLIRVKARQERLLPMPKRNLVRGANGHEVALVERN
jgi:hypothetical protein